MALLRKSITRVSLNIAGRIRERNKSADGKGVRNNIGWLYRDDTIDWKTKPIRYLRN